MGRPCINRSATKKSDEEQDYSKWDPVKWFSQRGYNVTQMIHAPANLTSRGLVRTSGTKVQAEEVGIVLVVLLLWAAAIALFINRWGKIRQMEPYHPYVEETEAPVSQQPPNPASIPQSNQPAVIIQQKPASGSGRNSFLQPGLSRERRPSLLCVLEQHARRQSTLSLLSAGCDYGNPSSRRFSTSSRTKGSTSSQVHHGQRRSSSNYQSNHSRTPGGLSRGCSGPTSGPPTFLVTNCNRSLGHRLHRNSDTSSLTRSSLNIDDSTKNRRRSLQDEARRLSAQFDDPYEDTRRRSIQSTFSSQNASSAVPGLSALWRQSPSEAFDTEDHPFFLASINISGSSSSNRKQDSLEMIGGISSTDASAATTNVIKQPQQPPAIVVPDIRTEQVYDILGGHSSLSSEVVAAANSTTKLLSSQPTNNKSVHSNSAVVAVDALNGDAKRVNLSSGAGINYDNPWLKYNKNCQPSSLELVTSTVVSPPVTKTSFRVQSSQSEASKIQKATNQNRSPSMNETSEAHIIVNEFFQSSPIEEKIESDV